MNSMLIWNLSTKTIYNFFVDFKTLFKYHIYTFVANEFSYRSNTFIFIFYFLTNYLQGYKKEYEILSLSQYDLPIRQNVPD